MIARLIAALVLLAGAVGLARPASFEARVRIEPSSGITETDTVRLILEIEGQSLTQMRPPALGGLENLRVLRGPDTQSNVTFINGRASAIYRLIWTLLPAGPGTAEVPPLEVQIGGERWTSERIRFEVGAGRTGPPAATPGPRQGGAPAGRPDGVDAFLEARLGSREVWVGEPVLLELYLHTAARVGALEVVEQPELDEFWVETIEVDAEAQKRWSTIGGRRYLSYPLAQKLVVPQSAGEFRIAPWVLQLDAQAATRDPFDLFFSRSLRVVRKSDAQTLVVKSLPAAGRPAHFSGAVGSYRLDVRLDREAARVNDAVALRATVEGRGFLELASTPEFEAPPSIKALDPKVEHSRRLQGGEMTSNKSWEWIVVPLAAGETQFPEVRFSYFDPEAGAYRELRAEPKTLVVQRGDGPTDPAPLRADLRPQQRDIAFIKALDGPLRERRTPLHERPGFLVLFLLPLVWAPVVAFLARRRADQRADRGVLRARGAGRRARRRLGRLRRRIHEIDTGGLHAELARALDDYLADRFDRSAAGLTHETADTLLAECEVDASLRQSFRRFRESCDFARFVPGSDSEERRREALEAASRLIEELDRAW